MTDKIIWRNMYKPFSGKGYYIGKVVQSCVYNLMRWPEANGAGKDLHAPHPADFFEKPSSSVLCHHIEGHLNTVAICCGTKIQAILHLVPSDVQTLRHDGTVALYDMSPKMIDLNSGYPFVVMNRAGRILCSSLCAKVLFERALDPVSAKKGSAPVGSYGGQNKFIPAGHIKKKNVPRKTSKRASNLQNKL